MKTSFCSALLIAAALFPTDSKADHPCVVDGSLINETYGVTEWAPDHFAISTSILIETPAETVWNILVSPKNDWSTTFSGIIGDVSEGSEVSVLWRIPGGRMTRFPVVLTDVEPGMQFGWSNAFPNAQDLYDNHVFRVQAISDGLTCFVHTDAFKGSGALHPNARVKQFADKIMPGYAVFNRELKAEAETR